MWYIDTARKRLHCGKCDNVIETGADIATNRLESRGRLIICTECLSKTLNAERRSFPDLAAIIAEQDAKIMRSFDPGI